MKFNLELLQELGNALRQLQDGAEYTSILGVGVYQHCGEYTLPAASLLGLTAYTYSPYEAIALAYQAYLRFNERAKRSEEEYERLYEEYMEKHYVTPEEEFERDYREYLEKHFGEEWNPDDAVFGPF